LAVHNFAPLPEVTTLIAKLSTFVVGSPPDLSMLAAEILLSPNKQLVYVSNRNDPSEEGDTIAVYSVATATKEPKLVREIRTGVTHARGMEFSKDGNYLAVVGNRTNSIRIFSVVEGSKDGEVKFVAGYTGLDKPTTLVWL
jgi:6-phosphogluconolactonase (cycloisomerase 2 family)